ncbi:hypothetical protein [Streptomyces sp. Inha503]|uniref:hypothetical protein n=1 Tax=Streptomyces sp. Inha503 TaxID=3383314 RepID=UPI0039A286BB
MADALLSGQLHRDAASAMAEHGHLGGRMATDHMAGMSPSMAHDGMHGTLTGMLAAHLLVGILSAWWLRGGEQAAFRLSDLPLSAGPRQKSLTAQMSADTPRQFPAGAVFSSFDRASVR